MYFKPMKWIWSDRRCRYCGRQLEQEVDIRKAKDVFKCVNCGYMLRNYHGTIVKFPEDLIEALLKEDT